MVIRTADEVRRTLRPELKCYASAVLVHHAAQRNAVDRLLLGLPEGVNETYLRDVNNHIDHATYRALEENIKAIMGDEDPQLVRELSRDITRLPGVVTVLAKALGTPLAVVKYSEKLNRELNIGQEIRVGTTHDGHTPAYHFFLGPMNELYLAQSEGGKGYFEGIPWFWGISDPMQITEPHSHFTLAKLLSTPGDYQYLGWNFQETSDGHFVVNGTSVAEKTSVHNVLGIPAQEVVDFYRAIFVTKKYHAVDDERFTKFVERKIREAQPWVITETVKAGKRDIFPQGRVYGMPCTLYDIEPTSVSVGQRLLALSGIAGLLEGKRAVTELQAKLADTRRLNEELKEKAELAEESARRIAYAAWAGGHLLEGAGSEATAQAGTIMTNVEGMIAAFDEMSRRLAAHPDQVLRTTVTSVKGYLETEALPGLSQLETVLGVTAVTFGPINTLFAREYKRLKQEGVNLREIADGVAARLNRTEKYTGRDNHIIVDGPSVELAGYDTGLITAYLFNLVNNAVWAVHQHRPVDGGRITISIGDEGDTTTLTVTDNGLGLHPDQHGAYLQGTISSRKGMGSNSLGTQSGKAIADYYGLERVVESNPNEGLRITTRLNKAAEYHQAEQTNR